jgi:aminoglycoside 6'-N-acetyltransferase I
MVVIVRAAAPADLRAVLDLAVAFYREDAFATTPADLRENLTALLVSGTVRAAVAEVGGAIAGFAITTSHVGLESGLVAELEDLYVLPEHRRFGIGSALVADSAAWSAALGARVLDVVIAPNGLDVAHLHTFYRARGFHDDDRRLVHLDLDASGSGSRGRAPDVPAPGAP